MTTKNNTEPTSHQAGDAAKDAVRKPIPRALYSCGICASDYSWPADDLFWSDVSQAWFCSECWDNGDHGERGVSLEEEIKTNGDFAEMRELMSYEFDRAEKALGDLAALASENERLKERASLWANDLRKIRDFTCTDKGCERCEEVYHLANLADCERIDPAQELREELSAQLRTLTADNAALREAETVHIATRIKADAQIESITADNAVLRLGMRKLIDDAFSLIGDSDIGISLKVLSITDRPDALLAAPSPGAPLIAALTKAEDALKQFPAATSKAGVKGGWVWMEDWEKFADLVNAALAELAKVRGKE